MPICVIKNEGALLPASASPMPGSDTRGGGASPALLTRRGTLLPPSAASWAARRARSAASHAVHEAPSPAVAPDSACAGADSSHLSVVASSQAKGASDEEKRPAKGAAAEPCAPAECGRPGLAVAGASSASAALRLPLLAAAEGREGGMQGN
jgi:hypothetical protein